MPSLSRSPSDDFFEAALSSLSRPAPERAPFEEGARARGRYPDLGSSKDDAHASPEPYAHSAFAQPAYKNGCAAADGDALVGGTRHAARGDARERAPWTRDDSEARGALRAACHGFAGGERFGARLGSRVGNTAQEGRWTPSKDESRHFESFDDTLPKGFETSNGWRADGRNLRLTSSVEMGGDDARQRGGARRVDSNLGGATSSGVVTGVHHGGGGAFDVGWKRERAAMQLQLSQLRSQLASAVNANRLLVSHVAEVAPKAVAFGTMPRSA
eukprot:6192206-Pleurochrysis_carterae.AAC.1